MELVIDRLTSYLRLFSDEVIEETEIKEFLFQLASSFHDSGIQDQILLSFFLGIALSSFVTPPALTVSLN